MRAFTAHQKRFIGTSALILLSLAFFAFFEESSGLGAALQGSIIGLVFFFVLPLAYCRLVLREPLSHLGWQKSVYNWALPFTLLVTAAWLALEYLLSLRFGQFSEMYFLPVLVEQHFPWFVLYEILMVPLIVVVYETFFRGLIQTLWLSTLGWYAVLVQAGLFYALFFVSTSFTWNALPLLLFAPARRYHCVPYPIPLVFRARLMAFFADNRYLYASGSLLNFRLCAFSCRKNTKESSPFLPSSFSFFPVRCLPLRFLGA
ncbi:MAG: hypothetical protein WDN67_02685 [Candidatus Moraniibacteriota bacterium]